MRIFAKTAVQLSSLLILAILLLSIQIDKKFIGHHDWNGVWYGSIARNNLRYGLLETKLGSVGGNETGPIDPHMYFTHYPPLFPLILTVGYWLFGDSEAALRIVVINFSMVTIIGLYLVGKHLYGEDVAFMAGFFAVVSPLFLYFGKMPVHEPIVLPCMVLSIYFYLCWIKQQNSRWYWAMVLMIGCSLLITWPAYYVPVALFLHYVWLKRRTSRQIILIILLPFVFFALHLAHVSFLTGNAFGGGIIEIFKTRISSSLTSQIYSLNPLKIIVNEFHFINTYFTRPVLLGAFIWLFIVAFRIVRKKKINYSDSILILLWGVGSLYIVMFSEAAYIHDYLIYYLLPFMTIAAARWYIWIISKLPNKIIKTGIIISLFLLVGMERRLFVAALLKSNHSEKGYLLGQFINKQTKVNSVTFVGSLFYNQFFSPFISYYSQRSIAYGESLDVKTLPPGTNLIIRPKAHDALDDTSKQWLDSTYDRHEDENYIWYEIAQK